MDPADIAHTRPRRRSRRQVLVALIGGSLLLTILLSAFLTIYVVKPSLQSSIEIIPGYDESGKYIILRTPGEEYNLREIRIGSRSIPVTLNLSRDIKDGEVRIPHNWSSSSRLEIIITTREGIIRTSTNTPDVEPHIEADVLDHGVAWVQMGTTMEAFCLLKLSTIEHDEVSILAIVSRNPAIPREIIIVETPLVAIEETTYSIFRGLLTNQLAELGLETTRIDQEDLAGISPRDSVIIMTTGAMPVELFSNDLYKEWVEAGCTIIYAGISPEYLIRRDGSLKSNDQQQLEELERTLDATIHHSPQSISHVSRGVFLDELTFLGGSWGIVPRYTDQSMIHTQVRTGVTLIEMMTDPSLDEDDNATKPTRGYFVLFPNTISDGWNSPQNAAHDLSDLILTAGWRNPLGRLEESFQPGKNAWTEITLLRIPIPDPPELPSHIYLQILIRIDHKGSTLPWTEKSSRVIELELIRPRSRISINQLLYANQTTEINALLVGDQDRPSPINLVLTTTSNGREIKRTILGEVILGEIAPLRVRYTSPLSPGEYLVQLHIIDQNTTFLNKPLVTGIFRVPLLEAILINTLESPGVSVFQIKQDHERLPNQNISIVIDGTWKQALTDQQGRVIVSTTSNTQDLTISVNGQDCIIKAPTPNPKNNGLPTGLLLLLLAPMAVGIRILGRKGNKQKLRVYLPKPVLNVERIQIKPREVVRIFQEVIKHFGWNHLPLTREEVGWGFAKFYRTPHSIGVELDPLAVKRLLEQCKKMGVVLDALGYWAPTVWIGEAKQSIFHLAMIRKARDILVKNQIRHQLSTAPYHKGNIPDIKCQTTTTTKTNQKGRDQRTEFFIELETGLKKDKRGALLSKLPMAARGRVLIVVQDTKTLQEYKSSINMKGIKGVGKIFTDLKKLRGEIQNKNLIFITLNELEATLKQWEKTGPESPTPVKASRRPGPRLRLEAANTGR